MKKLLAVLLGGGVMASYAQDRVYRKDGETLQGKVLEINSKEIVFQPTGEEWVYFVDRTQLVKIIFESGRAEWMQPPPEVTPFRQQRTWALKAQVFAPLQNAYGFASEWSWSKTQSSQVEVMFLRPGFDAIDWDSKGLAVGLGHRFYLDKQSKRNHRLTGLYLHPLVQLVVFSEMHPNPIQDQPFQRMEYRFLIPTLNLGYQHIFSNRWVMEVGYGVGYPLGTAIPGERYDPETGHMRVGNFLFRNNLPLTIQFNCSLGILLN
jgi:hypothetical protein